MVIEKIKLKDFRNYSSLELNLSNGLNILHGRNAQGKTNLLEGVYLCCVGKSMRGRDKELIRQGTEKSLVYVEALKECGSFTVEIHLSQNENKRISLNGIPILKMGELMGGINAVYFSPDELKLVKDAPQCRRKFLDIDLSQVSKRYFYTLLSYNKILLQRNNILKSRDKSVYSMLEIYDEQLADAGTYISIARDNFIKSIKGGAANIHMYLTGAEKLELSYQFCGYEPDRESFINALRKNKEKDTALGYTTIGPHRDDIKITADGIDVRVYGSQGQQRTCALSMKLSELDFFKENSGEYPVLLLDDVLSELDSFRKMRLLKFCDRVQTIITTADDTSPYTEGIIHTLFEVSGGNVSVLG